MAAPAGRVSPAGAVPCLPLLPLGTIRDGRLYRADHATFEEYCRERWGFARGFARNYANKVIAAAEVVGNLGTTVPTLPANERQARPLASLPAEAQPEVWREAVETAPASKSSARLARFLTAGDRSG